MPFRGRGSYRSYGRYQGYGCEETQRFTLEEF